MVYKQQGGFTAPITKLNDFEDCYVRAEFEQMELVKDEKTIKKPDELEKKRKERLATITAVLEKGLKLVKPSDSRLEVGNAKAMLAFQYMNAKKYTRGHRARRAVRSLRPAFGAERPPPPSTPCRATPRWLAHEEQAGATPEELKSLRGKMFDLAGYMEKNWAKEQAGDMARNQLALLYINEKDPDHRDENVQKAILALSQITPSYNKYTVTQYQFAQFALQAAKDEAQADSRRSAGRLSQASDGGVGESAGA